MKNYSLQALLFFPLLLGVMGCSSEKNKPNPLFKEIKASESGISFENKLSFDAAFVALQYGIKRLRGLGIPLSGPSYTSGNNKSRVTDLTKPET